MFTWLSWIFVRLIRVHACSDKLMLKFGVMEDYFKREKSHESHESDVNPS